MKTHISFLILALCSFVFTQCNEDQVFTENGSGSGFVLTINGLPSIILKGGDDDDEPGPIFDITGTVTNESGNPVSATVELVETSGNNLVGTTSTNTNGEFIFNEIPSGSYRIDAIVDGTVIESSSITL